jgi:hypothetical protein
LDKDKQGEIIVKEPDEDEVITQNEMKNNKDILQDLLIESPDKLKEVNKEIKKKMTKAESLVIARAALAKMRQDIKKEKWVNYFQIHQHIQPMNYNRNPEF